MIALKPEDILIIGAGPAGIAAALQLKRSGIPFILLERERVGGLLWNANLVENYPGFPAGITGPRLVHLFEAQMQRLEIEITKDEALQLDINPGSLHVTTGQGSYHPHYLIVATGTKSRPIPLDIPPELRDQIHTEVSHLVNVHSSRIVILGAGDAAFDYALNLAKTNDVTILMRGRESHCLPLLLKRAVSNPRIEIQAGIEISDLRKGTNGEVCFTCLREGKPVDHFCDYFVFAIGRQGYLDFLPEGKNLACQDLMNEHRLSFIGDVTNGVYRQTAIAVGDGLRAAMQIYTHIAQRED